MENFNLLILVGIAFTILVFVVTYLKMRSQYSTITNVEAYPYALISNLLTPTENAFYRILLEAVSGLDCNLLCKVRVADLLKVEKTQLPDGESWQKYFNKIQSKHIDFLICNEHMQPKLAIELDDSTHKRVDRQKRDEFINAAFKQAGLKLARVPVQKAYNSEKLRKGIERSLKA